MAPPTNEAKDVTVTTHYFNVGIMFFVVTVGYVPFILTILGYDRGTVIRQPLEPACQNRCPVSVPRSSVDKFDSFSLDSTQVLFVHFSGLSLNSANTTDILDPLNLVWVDSIEAPFLSLNLGFNVYSFTTLSRVVHHMKVKVEVEPISCLENMSYSCVTANLARTFLSNVTKERGVLCYAVNDSNTVNYRCCKGNVHTQQVECDIPAVLSPETAIIFKTIAIAVGIALLCFPALFNIVSDKKNSETLCTNSQVHNPLYHLVIYTVQALRHHSTERYWVNVIRKLLIGLALPTLYYIDWGLQWHTKAYDIPKMFNDAVENIWYSSKVGRTLSHDSRLLLIITVYYNVVVLLYSFLPRYSPDALDFQLFQKKLQVNLLLLKEKDIKLNWNEPYNWTKDYLCRVRSLFRKATDSKNSLCSRFAALLGGIVLMMLFPVVTVLLFISYTGHASPLGKMMRSFVYEALQIISWFSGLESNLRRHHLGLKIIAWSIAKTVVCHTAIVFHLLFSFALGEILKSSLLLFARLIVYLWIGLVASKDYYFPRIAVVSVFVYYSWNCLSSVTSRYQILLKQTFEKCKEHQEKQTNGRKAVTFDDKGVPTISSKLFQQVIDQILPRSEVYTKMILKLAIIILFLILIFSSILVYGKSNLNDSTKALAVLFSGLLPKLFEIFGEGSSYRQLCEMENACRVEKIVKDFLSQSTVNSYEQEEPSNPSGDQPPGTNTNERDQPTLTEHPLPKPAHSKVRSKESSKGNRRGDKHVLVVQADVNPRVQSINSSDDPSTEETPLLWEHRGKRDRNCAIV